MSAKFVVMQKRAHVLKINKPRSVSATSSETWTKVDYGINFPHIMCFYVHVTHVLLINK